MEEFYLRDLIVTALSQHFHCARDLLIMPKFLPFKAMLHIQIMMLPHKFL